MEWVKAAVALSGATLVVVVGAAFSLGIQLGGLKRYVKDIDTKGCALRRTNGGC